MTTRLLYLTLLALWVGGIWWSLDYAAKSTTETAPIPTADVDWPVFFQANILPRLPLATEFTPPLRPPDGEGAVVSLPFFEVGHLGEDWTTAKGDAARGEPVYSVADGWVSDAQDFDKPWGKVVFICYRLPEGRWPSFVEVMLAQLDTITVQTGQFVKRGEKIGTVGTGNETYPPHLHWEIRQTVGLGVGPGFGSRRDGWLSPSEFLAAHRGERAKQPLLPKVIPAKERDQWGTDY